jgi:hypothetical protein
MMLPSVPLEVVAAAGIAAGTRVDVVSVVAGVVAAGLVATGVGCLINSDWKFSAVGDAVVVLVELPRGGVYTVRDIILIGGMT